MSEAERDRIEAEAGGFVRACNGHVAALERSAAGSSGASTSSATVTAHRHGVALILAERLAGVSGVFDRARAARYGAAAAARAAGEARLRAAAGAARTSGAASPPPLARPRASPLRPGSAVAAAKADAARLIAASRAEAAGPSSPPPPPPQTLQQQQALATDSAALFAELQSLGTDVARAEATAREVAALSQAFSAQVASQAATIEGLYSDALAAVDAVGRGNVQLRKAVAAGEGGRRWTFYALAIAAVAILLADWLSS